MTRITREGVRDSYRWVAMEYVEHANKNGIFVLRWMDAESREQFFATPDEEKLEYYVSTIMELAKTKAESDIKKLHL